ncbi:MAG TPA: DUF5724 domain-containing protein [Fimbriimonadaceae bacterium]|jgi:hypothetical protein
MLDHKTAAERLKRFQRSKVRSDEDNDKLFKKLLAPGTKFGNIWDFQTNVAIGTAYRNLKPTDQERFLREATGKLHPVAKSALNNIANYPYQDGHARQPFRAPHTDWIKDKLIGKLLRHTCDLIAGYDHPITFFAEWIGYTRGDYNWAGPILMAAAIDAGDDVVLDLCVRAINGQDPIAYPCRAIFRALLACNRPSAWQEVEKIFLAAQRQEGLRQTILESVDELNAEAFKRFVRIVVEHNLLRFTSIGRALLTWMPGCWQESDTKSGVQVLGRVLGFLEDPELAPDYKDGIDVYLRLWAYAFVDIGRAIPEAHKTLVFANAGVRRSTVRLLSEIGLSTVVPYMKVALTDEDLTVSSIAIDFLFSGFKSESLQKWEIYDKVKEIAQKWPKNNPDGAVKRSKVWHLALTSAPTERLSEFLPLVSELSVEGRASFASRIGEIPEITVRRAAAVSLMGDVSPFVRERAAKALSSSPLAPKEAQHFEELLKRKASDLRQTLLEMLSKQEPEEALASGKRLIASRDKLQQQAGVELLSLDVFGRLKNEAKIALADSGPSIATESSAPPKNQALEKAALENGFGLYDPGDLTFCPRPQNIKVQLFNDESFEIISSLDKLMHEHRNDEVTFQTWPQMEGSAVEKTLLGDAEKNHNFLYSRNRNPVFEDLATEWLARHSYGSIDLVRAQLVSTVSSIKADRYLADSAKSVLKVSVKADYPKLVDRTLTAAIHKSAQSGFVSHILDLLCHLIYLEEDDKIELITGYSTRIRSWQESISIEAIRNFLTAEFVRDPKLFSDQEVGRAYQILKFIDEPLGASGRSDLNSLRRNLINNRDDRHNFGERDKVILLKTPYRSQCSIDIFAKALQLGFCNEADVSDSLTFGSVYHGYRASTPLNEATNASTRSRLSEEFNVAVDRFQQRIVEVESERGDLPTEATPFVGSVSTGIHLEQVLILLRKNVPIVTDQYGSTNSRPGSFMRLLTASRPKADETPELCAQAFREDRINPDRLLELGMLSPQWASTVEIVLGWPGLAEAIWWMHAHTKAHWWGLNKEIKEIREGAISERTPLTSDQFENGSVDVAWFNQFATQLNSKQWKAIEKVVKFASDGTGHARARLFGQALRGEVSVKDLIERIEQKRHLDTVRSLGLAPLTEDREADIRKRYDVLQEFLRTSRQFGSARQASEKLAVEIGLENLARTAGYEDPNRLIWALESKSVSDLTGNGKAVMVGDVEVRLFFDPLGEPQIEASKKGSSLKSIPASIKGRAEVKELTDRKTALKKQTQRMRLMLEQAMQRGDRFEVVELRKLMDHPGLKPMLSNLLFIGKSGSAGFLTETGELEGETESAIIAHPHDLLTRGDWIAWQHEVFRQERIQPFKQVFRELYSATENEKSSNHSTRYAGHQVQPRQTLAILGKRGWVFRPEEGVTKTLHREGLVAWLSFDETFYTPADIEGLTLEGLHFTSTRDHKPVLPGDVPPKVFSETMRDLDLIVSVASMVGIDPEASESTVEMRASVVREMCSLMRLSNVELLERNAIVTGKLAEYSVHLGSGVVHQRAKGELVIVAVRQPQRGRLFLPFVDDDPRTAEVASKVLLLARDHEIKDPTIISQFVRPDEV